MRKKLLGCIVVLCLGALVSGGCAKKSVVKTDDTTPTVETAPPATAPREVPPPVIREEPARPATPEAPMTEPTREPAIRQEVPQDDRQGSVLQEELQEIYFNFDSAALSDESRSILSKNAEVLAKQPSVKVRIEGNSDERGSDEYNLALGERRAKAARDYLVTLGVEPDRISIISYGEEKPAVQGQDEEAWAKNRRDEFVIVK